MPKKIADRLNELENRTENLVMPHWMIFSVYQGSQTPRAVQKKLVINYFEALVGKTSGLTSLNLLLTIRLARGEVSAVRLVAHPAERVIALDDRNLNLKNKIELTA